jgi:hypothetical protein
MDRFSSVVVIYQGKRLPKQGSEPVVSTMLCSDAQGNSFARSFVLSSGLVVVETVALAPANDVPLLFSGA